ncbi:MAG TPA: trypsin-like peptidase domain-containing protein [Acidimicrobiales bacterium]|nr:trypsin-like peptidase domain-containing protein [Acidimicrobiales bacterium]
MADISRGGSATTFQADEVGVAAREAQEAAARRFHARTPERMEKMGRLAKDKVADTPERMAKRSDRLRRYHAGEQLRNAPVALPGADAEAMAAAGAMLEKVINLPNFVDIRYLEAGVAAARAVGRIDIRNESNRIVGYGTASLVSTQLILTNHHVLPTPEVARWSTIQFNLQDGVDGQPLLPRMFRLDPDRFYMADKERDFAFVAVAASPSELAEFGFNPLIDAEGKAVVGECVTIVQHPSGEKKQVSLRENRLVDVLDLFLHYETDTQPGSSGSPVFNDQWEVVALHHASVPAPDHAELGHIANEGIRVSAVLKAVRAGAEALPAPMRQLLDGLFQDHRPPVGTPTSGGPAQAHVAQTPVAQTPVAQTPVAQTPVAQTPVAQTPVAQIPVTLASVSSPASVTSAAPSTGLQSMSAVGLPRQETVVATADGIRLVFPVEITLRLGTPVPATAAAVG